MQYFINVDKADLVIKNAPATKVQTVQFKRRFVRFEWFDYGTPMGWGEDFRVRVYLNNERLPFGSERIYKRQPWLPTTATIDGWNALFETLMTVEQVKGSA